MDDATLVWILALLLAAALAAWAYATATNHTLKRDLNRRAIESFNIWRLNELDHMRLDEARLARDGALVQLEEWKATYAADIRKDAIRRSDSVFLGKISEHFVPYLPEFEFNPKDARFLGSPVDFVVFDGLSEGDVRRVCFVEVKSGRSSLNTRERRVRDAVRAGLVEWHEVRPSVPVSETG